MREPSDAVTERDAETLRKLVEHENSLQNNRFVWFTSLEGLLFASLGFSWEKGSPLLVLIISLTGFLVSVSAHYALSLSADAFANLRAEADRLLTGYVGPPVKGLQVRGGTRYWTTRRWLLPERFLPIVFILAWTAVVVAAQFDR